MWSRNAAFPGNQNPAFRREAICGIVLRSAKEFCSTEEIMPFYRILLVARNDLPVASLYNKFVETAKYVMNHGGVFQRIYNTGDQAFR